MRHTVQRIWMLVFTFAKGAGRSFRINAGQKHSPFPPGDRLCHENRRRDQAECLQKFKQFGVTLPQYNVLRILRGQFPKPATVNLLIERMLDKTSNASRIVDKLEAKELVTRTQCPTDRRTVDILITEKGLTLLKQIDELNLGKLMGEENLTPEEAEQLSALLDKVRG